MSGIDGQDHGAFEDVAAALRGQRARLTPMELDRIKLDARGRAARRARSQLSQKGLFMRSRVFITALVAGGILMLGGGAALGVSGLTSTRSASIAQYGTTPTGTTTNVVTNVVTPPVTTTQGTTTQAPTTTEETPPTNEELGENGSKKPEAAVQGAKQVASNELPFTGYLAIPILVLGLAMLAGGFALRRSQRRLDS
jgi:hypothetical protein